ncbi:SLATT domain-containing protein [Intrasporangium oryzae]|uniref:SLATT domain-containing protein n=1 Tax=Intrasporangium oryzae TaxID=412687 RepID=UPI0012FAB7BF|nr:SLATT domain-containing protein [Intrasporangium oryzae]
MVDTGDTRPQNPLGAAASAPMAHPAPAPPPSPPSAKPVVAVSVADLRQSIRTMEKNAWLQAERHVTAAGFWGNFQWVAGGAAAVLAAAASATAFNTMPVLAGVLALLAAAAAALVTALRPGDISEQHLKAAASYNALQSSARDLDELTPDADADDLLEALAAMTTTWVETTSRSPRIPRRLLRKTTTFDKSDENYFPRPRWLSADESRTGHA